MSWFRYLPFYACLLGVSLRGSLGSYGHQVGVLLLGSCGYHPKVSMGHLGIMLGSCDKLVGAS